MTSRAGLELSGRLVSSNAEIHSSNPVIGKFNLQLTTNKSTILTKDTRNGPI